MTHRDSRLAFYCTVRLATRILLAVLHSFRVKDVEDLLGNGAYVIAANHINWFDGLVLIASFDRRITFLSASYLFEKPIVRRIFLSSLGCIPVGQTQTRQAIKEALDVLRKGGVIGVFPEGEVKAARGMEEIKRGAFFLAHAADVPIVPVGIQGTDRVFSLSRTIPRPGRITVSIGSPIRCKETDEETAEVVVARIAELVRNLGK